MYILSVTRMSSYTNICMQHRAESACRYKTVQWICLSLNKQKIPAKL